MKKEYSPYPFRMPAEVREPIEAKARDAGRSLQQEMLKRIELSMQLENFFANKNLGIDGLFAFIAESWRTAQTSESKFSELENDLVRLKEQNRLLVQSSNFSDDMRFKNIRRNLEQALQALHKAEADLPPAIPPIPRPPKNSP